MRKLVFCLIALACPLFGASAQYHGDLGPTILTSDTNLWFSITGDHDGFCDNTSGSWNTSGDLVGGTGYPDVDCWEWSSNSPRAVDQDCGTGNCTVSATVYCPYLHVETHHWLTFTCTGSASEGVRSGIISQNPLIKGVRCGDVACGCMIIPCNGTNGPCPYAVYDGYSTPIGGNSANLECQ